VKRNRFWIAIAVLGLATLPAAALADGPGLDTTGTDWGRASEYRIVPGDKLVLNFGFSSSSPTGFLQHEVKVRPDGRISVFPVGDVVAAGHTTRELEKTLVDLLAESLKQPRVVVEVAEIAANEVHVLGEVNKPGSYPAEPFITVLQALAQAGGFKDGAAKNNVLVFHRDGARNVSIARIQVDRALKRGSIESDIPLSRFDIVYVPRSGLGNAETIAHQFFDPLASMLTSGLVGWELFNLDRVYVRANR
jgi:polysaccharide export outer membrane protein